jgi:hypothetical protein
MSEEEELKRREQEYDLAFDALKSELKKEKDVVLTGDVNEDFPELFEKEIDFDDKTNEYIKKSLIEEVVDNVEVRKDNSIYDKRLKQPLFKRIIDALFNQ